MTGEFLSVPRYNWCTPLSQPSFCMLVNHGPKQLSSKGEYKPWKLVSWCFKPSQPQGITSGLTSHGNEVLQQDTTHLIQRPCYQRGSLCQHPAGKQTTWRPPDHHKEMQTAVVWSCLQFVRSGQNHLARHSERGKRQGRQRKRWTENIREWTGLEFTKSQRALENREKWKLVAKSFVVKG